MMNLLLLFLILLLLQMRRSQSVSPLVLPLRRLPTEREISIYRPPLALAGRSPINNGVFVLTFSTGPPIGCDQRRRHSESLWDTHWAVRSHRPPGRPGRRPGGGAGAAPRRSCSLHRTGELLTGVLLQQQGGKTVAVVLFQESEVLSWTSGCVG